MWDSVALQGNGVVVILAGLAAIVFAFAVGMKKGDGVLGAHVGTIGFAYLVPFLLAMVGTYAIFLRGDRQIGPDAVPRSIRRTVPVSVGCRRTGECDGSHRPGRVWAERRWGRFWGWDAKEIGGLSVVVSALILYLLLARFKPGSVQLGQASLIMSLVTFAAWFGPMVFWNRSIRRLLLFLLFASSSNCRF